MLHWDGGQGLRIVASQIRNGRSLLFEYLSTRRFPLESLYIVLLEYNVRFGLLVQSSRTKLGGLLGKIAKR